MTTHLSALLWCLWLLVGSAYSEFPATPESFNDAKLVERHGGKEHLAAVGVA